MNVAEARAREFLERYGEKGELVLRAALETAEEYRKTGKDVLGDFDYKGVVRKLKLYGLEYNPSPLLSKLEKEYSLIETTYKSSGQHWWRFVDEESIRLALEGDDEEELEDPEVAVLKVQIAALELDEVKERLLKILNKKKMSVADKKWFKNFAFETLPLIAQVAQKVLEEGYEDDPELLEPVRVLQLAMKVAKVAKVKAVRKLELPALKVEE
ncbi:hypothetical protein IPA_03055 [Ignicoccus pacificus DSM 13166]|uniref:Uncharacterized protein n=1 Tax=Ignicoccus pacificus DSM 13166 TaxID=940294 RepID=A0A977K9B4_9CREN|nr:hypothetical protein IPA_03055 [Ignicoccus pacificus DSM 13166]